MKVSGETTFAVGLLALSREWPLDNPKQPPSPEAAKAFILNAYREGVRFFDMAPAYASGNGSTYRSAEMSFGQALQEFPEIDRSQLIVATKFGEHYDPTHNPPYFADHSAAALKASLDRSIAELGTTPDILFVHKMTADLLLDEDKRRELYDGLAYARDNGIPAIGASVSDIETAHLVLQDSRFTYLQFPFSAFDTKFEPVLQEIEELRQNGRNIVVAINRPLGMGKGAKNPDDAFAFIEQRRQEIAPHVPMVVLSGTSNSDHLLENYAAFTHASGRRFSS